MIRTVTLLVLILGLVIPVSAWGNEWAGCAFGWLLAAVAIFVVVRFLLSVQTEVTLLGNLALNGVDAHSRADMPSVLSVVDVYLFSSLAISIVWYTAWVLDDSISKTEHINLPSVAGNASPYLAFVVTAYNTMLFRIRPVNALAYVWGYVVVLAALCALVFVLSLYRRSICPAAAAAAFEMQHQQQEYAYQPPMPTYYPPHQQQQQPQPAQYPVYGQYPVQQQQQSSSPLPSPSPPPPPTVIPALMQQQQPQYTASVVFNMAPVAGNNNKRSNRPYVSVATAAALYQQQQQQQLRQQQQQQDASGKAKDM